MRLDPPALLALMEDGTDREVVLELLERLLDLDRSPESAGSMHLDASAIKGVGRHYTRFQRTKARKSATFKAEKPSN